MGGPRCGAAAGISFRDGDVERPAVGGVADERGTVADVTGR